MVYLLTDSGTSKGWGKPEAVFDNKEKLAKWIEADMENMHKGIENIKIKDSAEKDGKINLTVSGRTPENGCFHNYEIFTFILNADRTEGGFFS